MITGAEKLAVFAGEESEFESVQLGAVPEVEYWEDKPPSSSGPTTADVHPAAVVIATPLAELMLRRAKLIAVAEDKAPAVPSVAA